jgi:hypothetical protein
MLPFFAPILGALIMPPGEPDRKLCQPDIERLQAFVIGIEEDIRQVCPLLVAMQSARWLRIPEIANAHSHCERLQARAHLSRWLRQSS